MDVKIFPTTFNGTLDMIGSKSLSHRYLIGAALSSEKSTLYNLMESEDIIATKTILKAMGASIYQNSIKGPSNQPPSEVLDARASGSTLRFLIPLTMRFNEPVTFMGKDRLPKRSLAAYLETFKSKNVEFIPQNKNTWLPLKVKGPLSPGDYVIKGDISSQFVSGLCFLLPLLNEDSKIILKGEISSKSYIQMTLDVLNDFDIKTTFKDNIIYISGNQTYQAIKKTIEGDYSHSVFFLSGALLDGAITLNHLPKSSLQGDHKVLSFLKDMGAQLSHEESRVKIQKTKLNPVTLDLDDTPDLAPMLMALSAFTEGKTTFTGLKRLKHKESDRLAVMKEILTKIGIVFEGDEDQISIQGKSTLFEVTDPFDAKDDHRIAMTLAMIAPKAKAPYIVKGFECIQKSYPKFLEDYQKIGGKFEIMEEKR